MIIPLLIGAVAIFIWSQFASKKPVEKTEVLEGPLPESKDVMDVFKENAPKVAAIVGGAGALVKVLPSVLPAAKVMPEAVLGMLPKPSPALSPVTGGTSVAKTLGGAALVAAPLIVVPIIAKILDKIFPKHVVTESEQAAMDAASEFRAEVASLPGVTLIKGQHTID